MIISVPGGTEAPEEGGAFVLQSLSDLPVAEPDWDERSGKSFVITSIISVANSLSVAYYRLKGYFFLLYTYISDNIH